MPAQLAPLQHIQTADGHDEVAVHHAAVCIHKKAAVGVAVERNARLHFPVGAHIVLQGF